VNRSSRGNAYSHPMRNGPLSTLWRITSNSPAGTYSPHHVIPASASDLIKENRCCRLRPILYLTIEETSDRGICLYLVGTLTEAMPFVLEAQIFYRDATST
jgi:hypothetical protein